MYTIERNTVSDAHKYAVKCILEEGELIITEDEKATIELDEPLSVLVAHPFREPMIHSQNPLRKRTLDEYISQIISTRNTGFAYTYGQRLRDYTQFGYNEKSGGIDQLTAIGDKLKENPTTRRAIAQIWNCYLDLDSPTPPCFQTFQFTIRNGLLNLVATCRSNDICMAWGANAYGFAHLMQWMVDYVDNPDVEVGYLQTVSNCAHIYESDLDVAKRIAYL